MVALIDCNNFYVSCERVFNPSLIGKALIVLSNNDGCAIARSEEAKAVGIKMAQPAFMINDLMQQHNVQACSSNYTLYGDMSHRVMQVIKEYVPVTEVYSIDEVFADLSSLKFKDHLQLARDMREAVTRCTGIPVSIGIGPTKTLAKMANRYAKKTRPDEGVFVAECPQLIHNMLCETPVGGIWGVGKQHEDFLNRNGFFTAADLVNAPQEWVRKNMSVVGQRLLHELKGIPCIKWEEKESKRKNICTSRSFGQLVSDKKAVKQAVAKFTAVCGEKLRKEKTCARKMNVFIQTNPHRPMDDQYFQSVTLDLTVPVNTTTELIRYSMKGLDLIFRNGYQYQKAGVIVMDLVPASEIQLALFQQHDEGRGQKLMEAVDNVNKTFGKDMVRLAVHDFGKDWHLKRESLSPNYTTSWKDIPKAM